MYVNPYQNCSKSNECQRANFHTHAGTGPNTCGHYGIDEVLSSYKQLDYGVICLSNHDLYIDNAPYENHDICLIDGYEYTKDPHIVCVGTKEVCKGSHQDAIDDCNKSGGFAVLCHPNWKREWYLSRNMINSLKGFVGVEIYNGSIDCGKIRINNPNGRCNAQNSFDYILSQGRLIWCFGNDDFHRWQHFAVTWNMIYAKKDAKSVIEAVKKGEFYASTGLMLEYLTLKDDRINVSVINNEGFKDVYRYKFIGKHGHVLKEVVSENASYEIMGHEMYIRVEVISTSGKMLFTQPVYEKESFRLETENAKI